MIIKVIRDKFTEESTIGKLYINGVLECNTLEDKDRKLENGGTKVYALTAIPRGTYTLILSYSHRFKKYLPEIQNVPGFAGIRIHPGNKASDTEGCILLGTTRGEDIIGVSRLAFEKFMAKVKKVEKTEKITIEIG